MNFSDLHIWGIILALGIGTYLIRFSFIGLIGDREYPAWILRVLRYTPVAVMPGLVAPLILWPQATDGLTDPARLAAAAATLLVGLLTRNILWAIPAGLITLYAGLYFL